MERLPGLTEVAPVLSLITAVHDLVLVGNGNSVKICLLYFQSFFGWNKPTSWDGERVGKWKVAGLQFSDTNIRLYHICIIFLIQIYLDICSYCFSDTNIYGYNSLYRFLIQIYSRNKSCLCAKKSKIELAQIVHTQINIQRKLLYADIFV